MLYTITLTFHGPEPDQVPIPWLRGRCMSINNDYGINPQRDALIRLADALGRYDLGRITATLALGGRSEPKPVPVRKRP